MTRHFGDGPPEMILEPGRGIAGDAGVIQTEVVLISRKSYDDERRWVYLDIGRFDGLPEVMNECIKYRIRTPRDGGPVVGQWSWRARPTTRPTSFTWTPIIGCRSISRSGTGSRS